MKVKIFDENHERDLENDINCFINENDIEIVDIQFRTAVSIFSSEQVYCFSAMILYK
ncbi:MAG: sporulation protein Cse60 [Bacilli bacterium]|nr:sporulation protein Cse60 [Bacilli bacterium]